MEAFKVEVETPVDDMPGKIKLTFNVPYMWFAFYRPIWSVLGPRTVSNHEKECQKRDVVERFLDLIRREIYSAWPEIKE